MNDQTPTHRRRYETVCPVIRPGSGARVLPRQAGVRDGPRRPLPQFGGRWIEVAPPGGIVTLALVPDRAGVPGVQTGLRLATGDAAAPHAELQSSTVDVGELLRWPGIPAMFAFRDQDGNSLTIVEAA